MQLVFRHGIISICFGLAVLLCQPGAGLADPVTEALGEAQESASQSASENMEQPTEIPDADTAGPLQAAYPGIENVLLQTGGNGGPTSAIWYPRMGQEKIDATLKEFAEAEAAEYAAEIKDSIGPDGKKPESWSMWEQNGFFTLQRPNPDIISFTFNIYSYTGGAHGQFAICVFNFNTKTGQRLTPADLFADPGKAIEIMSRISAARLRESLGEDADEEMIRDGTQPEEANFANLSLLADGLDVEFQPYQVGPWSIGQQQVKITLEELEPAGPNAAVWPKQAPPAVPQKP